MGVSSDRELTEERFQSLGPGIDLLNLMLVVDALRSSEPITEKKNHALRMFLAQHPLYAREQEVQAAFDDLKAMKKDITPGTGVSQQMTDPLSLESPEAQGMLLFILAASEQVKSNRDGLNLRYPAPEIGDPVISTKLLIDELLAKL